MYLNILYLVIVYFLQLVLLFLREISLREFLQILQFDLAVV